jgi:hypothetical protein
LTTSPYNKRTSFQFINPLIRCVQAQLQGVTLCGDAFEVLSQRACEVAGQRLIDVLAVVVTLEHGLEQIVDVAASTIGRVQVKARLDWFVFYGHKCPWSLLSYS